MYCVCHAFGSVHCCLVNTCWERLTFWLSFVVVICVCYFSLLYHWSGVVLDCIDPDLCPFSNLLCSFFYFCKHLNGEEKAGCFTLSSSCLVIVFFIVLFFRMVPWVGLQ